LGLKGIEAAALNVGGARLSKWATDALASRSIDGRSMVEEAFDDLSPTRVVDQAPSNAKSVALVAVSSGKAPSWSELPKVISMPLPSRFREALLSHPEIKKLREEFGSGSGMKIYIKSFRNEVESGAMSPRSGEEIQSVFLKKVLGEALPDAQVIGYQEHLAALKIATDHKAITITVEDSAEFGGQIRHDRGHNVIEMVDLKSVNPGPEAMAKTDLRASMGLPAKSKIASVYASLYSDATDALVLSKDLLKTQSADIVILSHADAKFMDSVKDIEGLRGIKIVTTSQLESEPIVSGQKYIVINNTRGQMPYVHGVADYAVVAGAANVYEPLNMGIPTFYSRHASNSYEPNAWREITDLAGRTGGGKTFDTTQDIVNAVKKGELNPPQTPSYMIADHSNGSAMDRLFKSLSTALHMPPKP
jgi:hypothetical protein